MEPLFELRGASVGYEGRPVLVDIDLTIRRGERVAVMGRSGAGKSTLIKLLFGQRPAEIALVPQAAALVRTLSVFHNVFMGRLDRRSTLHNLRTLVSPRRDDVEEVGRVLDSVGLADKLFAAAGTLSGGQGSARPWRGRFTTAARSSSATNRSPPSTGCKGTRSSPFCDGGTRRWCSSCTTSRWRSPTPTDRRPGARPDRTRPAVGRAHRRRPRAVLRRLR
jgi:hypothetical protein